MFTSRSASGPSLLLCLCLGLLGCGATIDHSATPSSALQLQVQTAGTGAGTITSSPAGINCGASCSAQFVNGTTVTLTATPNATSAFAGWAGACSGTGACSVPITANASVTATFTANAAAPPSMVQLNVQDAGTGAGTITSSPAGINCGSTCSASFPAGTQVMLIAAPNATSTFAGWSGSCSGTGACTVPLSASASVTATFTANPAPPASVQLTVLPAGNGAGTVTSSPAGINCGATCTASFPAGTAVALTATPNAASTFAGWSGACSGTGACSVPLAANASVTATFTANPPPPPAAVQLTVQPAGNGAGTVISNPAGINCGSTCAAGFPAGTTVMLSATPSANSTFAGWSGACTGTAGCSVALTANASVTATFTATPPPPASFQLTVLTSGGGAGTVTSTPAGIDCGTTCSASFNSGATVSLTETPNTGSTFEGWSGACTGTGACNVSLTGNATVTATFATNATLGAINHIVFLAQENRSMDHYFGAMRDYWAKNGYPDQSFDGLPQFNPTSGQAPLRGPAPTNPGCDPTSPPPGDCLFDPQNPVTSFHLVTQCIENTSPSWNEAHVDWNPKDELGLYPPPPLDGYVKAAGHDSRYVQPPFIDTDGIRAMGYYTGSDLNYYYFMASNFATSDRWFHAVMTRTHPNREFLIAGTSEGRVYPNGTNAQDTSLLTATTIFEELQNAGVSWKIYVNTDGSSCTGPPYDPACLLKLSYVQNFTFGQTIVAKYPQNLAPISQYYTDVANGTLPQVAQIEPATEAGDDEHPSTSDGSPTNVQRGAKYVSTLINSLMQSRSWNDSAFILTFDENGGLYDHVAPQPAVSPDGIKPVDLMTNDVCTKGTLGPLCDFTFTGYRVPLIVVSPFARKNYVSHKVADITAILKLIETRFNLPALTKRDASQIDMTEFFDFSNPPWVNPPTPPVQATNGPCYLNSLP